MGEFPMPYPRIVDTGHREGINTVLRATPKVEGVNIPDPDTERPSIREPIIRKTIEYVEIDGIKYPVQEEEVPQIGTSEPDSHKPLKRKYIIKDEDKITVGYDIEMEKVTDGPIVQDAPVHTREQPIVVRGVYDKDKKFHPVKEGYVDKERGLQPTRKQVLDDLIRLTPTQIGLP